MADSDEGIRSSASDMTSGMREIARWLERRKILEARLITPGISSGALRVTWESSFKRRDGLKSRKRRRLRNLSIRMKKAYTAFHSVS